MLCAPDQSGPFSRSTGVGETIAAGAYPDPIREIVQGLSVLKFGDPSRSPDIVFLHANGMNAEAYRSWLELASLNLAIWAVDQRGHGRTELPLRIEGRTTYDDLRDDFIALLNMIEGPPPIVVGHSLGAIVALLAAAECPARCRQLILFEPVMAPSWIRTGGSESILPGTRKAGRLLARSATRRRSIFASRDEAFEQYFGRGAFASLSDRVVRDYLQSGMRDRSDGAVELSCSPAWEASNYTAFDFNPLRALRGLQFPIWILCSELGSTCRIGSGSVLHWIAPHIEIATISGTTHMLPLERPELVASLVAAANAGSRLCDHLDIVGGGLPTAQAARSGSIISPASMQRTGGFSVAPFRRIASSTD